MNRSINHQEKPQSDTAQLSLDNPQLRKARVKTLKHGKVKKLGFFEMLKMKFLGWRDGRRGLPTKDNCGEWQSAHLDHEVNAYEEFSSLMWGNLLIEREKVHNQLRQLYVSISTAYQQLCNAKAELEDETLSDELLSKRKAGEERLTDDQVKSRRSREQEKRLAPLKGRIQNLRHSIDTQIEQFCQIQSKLPEDVNITRMICNRVKDHTLERADVYWNAALRHHPEQASMPTIPVLSLPYSAEAMFMDTHQERMREIDALSIHIKNIQKEVA